MVWMSVMGEKSHEPEQHRRAQPLVKASVSWSVRARRDLLAGILRSLLGSAVWILLS